MQRVNEFTFYELATAVHALTELQDDSKLTQIWSRLWTARQSLRGIVQTRPLSVSQGAASRLISAISGVIPDSWDEMSKMFPTDTALEEPVNGWQLYQIKVAAGQFETVLAAECAVMDTYLISRKGVFSTADLVEHAHEHFPEPLRSRLPGQTRIDFDQAGKCLAFDLPTAAAFHMLRGTEASLRHYYEAVVPGPKQAAPKMRNWGVYIGLLERHGADKKIVSLLSHLKDSYRNPVQHPEENYTEGDAQALFGFCVSAVMKMTEATEEALSKGGQLAFPEPGAFASALRRSVSEVRSD